MDPTSNRTNNPTNGPPNGPRWQERRARMERMQQSRRSMLRWRWVMVALGGVLAAALLASGNVVIGGILAVLMVMRIVMITKMQRMMRERDAAFARRTGTGGAGGGGAGGSGQVDGFIDVT